MLHMSLLSAQSQVEYLSGQGHLIQPKGNMKIQTLLSKIEAESSCLKKYAEVKFGMQLRNRKLFPTDVLVNPKQNEITMFHRKCLTGKNIHPYWSEYTGLYCNFNREAKCGGCWDETIHNAPVKVLVRQVGAVPVCGIDTNGFAVLNSAFMIVANSISPYVLLALINSKLIQFYWRTMFEDKRKTFPKIKGTYLENIPIVCPKDGRIESLVRKVCDKMQMKANCELQEIGIIDFLVYHLYNLTYDEVLVVDPKTPITREQYESGEYKG